MTKRAQAVLSSQRAPMMSAGPAEGQEVSEPSDDSGQLANLVWSVDEPDDSDVEDYDRNLYEGLPSELDDLDELIAREDEEWEEEWSEEDIDEDVDDEGEEGDIIELDRTDEGLFADFDEDEPSDWEETEDEDWESEEDLLA